VITRRHELAQRAQQGLLPIWPLAPLLLGCACFLTAKLSRWRRRRLIAVGAAGLSPGFAALYLVGYLLMGLGTWLMLGW